jgi:hypothetical protein
MKKGPLLRDHGQLLPDTELAERMKRIEAHLAIK